MVPEGWQEVTVEDLKATTDNALATGPFGSSISSSYFQEHGVPVIRGNNLSEEVSIRLSDDGLVFVSEEKAAEFKRSTVRKGDLVFTCWGTINQVGLIDKRAMHGEYVISNKQMKFTPDPRKADSLFLYYLFSGPEMQDLIKSQGIGSSVPGFNLGQLRAMSLKVPQLNEQRAIAHILGALDDKIELNRRMNETLEAMARAIFKSWFVDFDPVRAKAEGRDTGLAHELKEALTTYTESDGKGRITIDQEEAVATMLEKYEVCRGLFYGFDWSKWATGAPAERLGLLPSAQEHILQQEDGKGRLLHAVNELSKAFALAVPHEDAMRTRDDVAFFQAVRASLSKRAPGETKAEGDLDHALRQIVSRAVASEGVLDIFAAAGLKKPDISILSEEFLAEVNGMPQRNLAVELLRKLLSGEIRMRGRKNVVQARSFSEMLEQAIRRYQNRAIEAAQVIEELIELARQMREAKARDEALGLTEDEVAFYDALEVNDSAVKVLGDETLRAIARELVATVRANVKIDWTVRENVRAQLRVLVKRILRKHGYPPDKQEKATQTVLEQAEVLSEEWVTGEEA